MLMDLFHAIHSAPSQKFKDPVVVLYMECVDNAHRVCSGMGWVEEEVVGEGNDRARHFQHGARFCLQPLRARAA
jgi:hypothetical protein